MLWQSPLIALQYDLDFYCALQYIPPVAGPNSHQGGGQQQGAVAAGKGTTMVKDFEEIQKLGKDNMDLTLRSLGAVSKSAQAIAVEVTDYSKKSFEQGTQAMERLFGVKSLDKAIEVQTDYAKTAYEGFVAQASKLGTLYAELAKESYKPLEGYFARATATK
jgi:hypothetical protein